MKRMRRAARIVIAAGGITAAAVPPATPASAGMPGSDRCGQSTGAPVFEVTVRGFRAPTGHILVYLYRDDPRTFLARGRWTSRTEVPVRRLDPVSLCVPAPGPGRYAISVRHDVDGNRQRSDASDGGGFSRNPRLSIVHLRPAVGEVAVTIEGGIRQIDIVLNYRRGLRVEPWRR